MSDKQPNLGLATTRELLDELEARIDVDVSIGDLPSTTGISLINILGYMRGRLDDFKKLDYKTVQDI